MRRPLLPVYQVHAFRIAQRNQVCGSPGGVFQFIAIDLSISRILTFLTICARIRIITFG